MNKHLFRFIVFLLPGFLFGVIFIGLAQKLGSIIDWINNTQVPIGAITIVAAIFSAVMTLQIGEMDA